VIVASPIMRPIEEQRVGRFRGPFSDLALGRGEAIDKAPEVDF
jgi:hypothetical protein